MHSLNAVSTAELDDQHTVGSGVDDGSGDEVQTVLPHFQETPLNLSKVSLKVEAVVE